jgi:hypothetical protein
MAVVAGNAAVVIKRFASQWKSDSSPGKTARIPARSEFPVNVCGVIRRGLGRAEENRMAKGSDNLADSFDAENTGGVLSGFLAEEEVLDRRALWRIGSWGVGAVGAVIVGILANQSSIGSRREQLAAADLARQSQQIQSLAKESQNETRRLASAIDTLNGDRDRLFSRVSVLEQGLDSVTGAIVRQKSPLAATPSAAAAAGPPMSAAAAVQAATQSPTPPPLIGPVTTIAASSADRPQMEAATAPAASPSTVASVVPETPGMPAVATPATTPAAAATPSSTPATAAATPAPPAPLMESKSMMAPPDPAAAKLIEPEAAKDEAPKNDAQNADTATPAPVPTPAPDVVASVPAAAGAAPDSTQSISQPAVQRTEFAVDVGGANSIGGLRALWRGLLKSRSNAPLAALQPIIVVKESNTGLGMQLRLVAGPLGDAAAAAKICAAMMESKRTCETTVFDGQRLAMKAGDEPAASAAAAVAKSTPDKPAAAKPAAIKPVWHRHNYAKRAMAADPPKPPDPPPSTLSTTLSSYFGSSKSAK